MLILLAACAGPPAPTAPSSDDPVTGASLPAPRPPHAPAPVPWTEEGAVPALDDPAGWIFDPTVVHEMRIDLDPDDIDALFADPYTAVMADLTFDGVVVPDVGVRLKGKIGSFRDLYGKSSFKIDFGEFAPGGEFWSLERLVVNGDVVDCTHLKTAMGYRVFALAGLPSLRTGFAMVTVGDQPYGLYTLVENPDEPWLERGYPDSSDGNLYDGKYVWYGGWSYTLLDFDQSVQDLYDLEEGVDVGHADIHAVTAAIDAGGPDFYANAGEVVDWDHQHAYWAVEQWIGHVDGYAMNQNNNFVYFDPADGKMDMHPWDLDYAFIEDWEWGMSWQSPRGRLAAACWGDATCRDAQRQAVADLLDVLDGVDLVAEHDAMATVIAPYANELDARRECGSWTPDELRPWLATRSDALRSFWGL